MSLKFSQIIPRTTELAALKRLKNLCFHFFSLCIMALRRASLPVGLLVFFSELSPLVELCPFEGLKVQICNHDISKIITARSFKLGQLIEDDE